MIYRVTEFIELNDNSLALIVVIVALLGWKWLTRLPFPQLNPFLLGRQSITSATRLINESPIYISASSGGINSPLRPNKGIRTLDDILKDSNSILHSNHPLTSIKSGDKINVLVKQFRLGLLNHFSGSKDGLIAILIQDQNHALLISLALATSRLKPLILSPDSIIPETLNQSIVGIIHSSNLNSLAQQLPTNHDTKWLQVDSTVAEDVFATGKALLAEENGQKDEPDQPTDLAVVFISDGILLEFTHLNITSALVTWLGLFPPSPSPQVSTRPTVFDTILSFHHPSTPYGFGLALLAIYTNASLFLPFVTPVSPSTFDAMINAEAAPLSTLVFIPKKLVNISLYPHVLQKMEGDSSLIIRYSRTGKLNLLRQGILVQDTFWDWLLFRGVTKDAGLAKLRALFIAGPIKQSKLDFFRITFGCAVVSTLEITCLLAPITSGMLYDVQRLPPPHTVGQELNGKELGHVGFPTAGISIKLIGEEEGIQAGARRGEIVIRSAMLPNLSTSTSSSLSNLILSQGSSPSLPAYPTNKAVSTVTADDDASVKWFRSGLRGEVSKEGVLWL